TSTTPTATAGSCAGSTDGGRGRGRRAPFYSGIVLKDAATTTRLYVAVGASDAVGVGARRPRREAWPRLLHRRVFGGGTRFVNLGVSGATVADALAGQVPRAEQLRPDVVTVWLVVNDIVAEVPVERYESDLDALVGRLRRGGATRVLIGNCPYLDRLPAYLMWRALGMGPDPDEANAVVDRYNAIVEGVAVRHDATLVDLRSAALAARRAGIETKLFAPDGFHPSSAGHRALAATFGAALLGGRAAGRSGHGHRQA